MATGYLRYPHVHGDLISFVAGDDVWLFDIGSGGGRAWRLSADGTQVGYPRFSRDGTSIAWTSWRDGGPEVYVADTAGGDATRLTFWGDPQTRVTGWTAGGEVLVVSAAGQQATKYRRAFAVPGHGDAPPRLLPYGPVNDLAIDDAGDTALLTGSVAAEPAYWKRYRGGRAGKLWVASAEDPLFTRILSGLGGQLASPMLIGGRLLFLSLLFNLLLSCWFPAPWRLCRRRGGWQVGGFSRRAAFRDLAFRVSVRP
jgi:tricorn protease